MDVNKFYSGDCLELIKKIPAASIDLIIADGPYGVTTHAWDQVGSIQEYNLKFLMQATPLLKPGGALYLFGKADCIDFIDYRKTLNLQRKIIWYQPARLAQGRTNYTNNYDVICYFTKGLRPTVYNLDAIRVSQLVELAHRQRCEQVPSVTGGKFSKTKFNSRGKNPGDVWGDIKQLTYKSKELLSREFLHTIQKPERLIERLVLASSNPGDLVLDPFAGTGTTAAVCKRHERNFLSMELNSELVALARKRVAQIPEPGAARKSAGRR